MHWIRALGRGHFLSITDPNRTIVNQGKAFSTNYFLDHFSADPAEGCVFVPKVEMDLGKIEGTIPLTRPLQDSLVGFERTYYNEEEGDSAFFMLRDRIGEVQSIIEEAKGDYWHNIWDYELPYTLPATSGEWTVHPMRWRDEPVTADKGVIRRSYNAGVVLRSRGGKHVAFWRDGPDGGEVTVGVGNAGKYAVAYQNARIELPERVGEGKADAFTESYFMRFVGLGMQALKQRVCFTYGGDAWMAYTALGVANAIYLQRLHSSETSTKIPRMSCDGRDYELIEKGGKLTFPSSFTPSNRELSISLSDVKTPHDGRIDANITLGRDSLLIDINRGDNHTESHLRLGQSIVTLWEGAQILANADPDDGGYLAGIM
jgi:hypothetical protein